MFRPKLKSHSGPCSLSYILQSTDCPDHTRSCGRLFSRPLQELPNCSFSHSYSTPSLCPSHSFFLTAIRSILKSEPIPVILLLKILQWLSSAKDRQRLLPPLLRCKTNISGMPHLQRKMSRGPALTCTLRSLCLSFLLFIF